MADQADVGEGGGELAGVVELGIAGAHPGEAVRQGGVQQQPIGVAAHLEHLEEELSRREEANSRRGGRRPDGVR